MDKVVTVIGGCGKLGLPLSCRAADRGFIVYAADIDKQAVDMISAGKSPIYEPGVEIMIGWEGPSGTGRLRPTTEIVGSCAISDFICIIVPTPSNEDGSFSLEYIEKAVDDVAAGMKLYEGDGIQSIIIISTVNPGDTRKICKMIGDKSGKGHLHDFDLIYSPEFLALGDALFGISYPDIVLLGADYEEQGWHAWREFYKHLIDRTDCELHVMSWESAEIAKIGLNAALVTKIGVANQLMWLCHKVPGASATQVLNAVGADSRIGKKFFKPGLPPGGPCLPRDSRALSHAIDRWDSKVSVIADASGASIREQYNALCGFIDKFNGRIGVLGLTYKAGVNIPDEGMGINIAGTLTHKYKRHVVVYDPQLNGIVGLTHASSVQHLLSLVDIIVIATPWREFEVIHTELEGYTVIDCWGLLAPLKHNAKNYIRIGENNA